MAIGGLIRDLRSSHGWSQTDLAAALCLASGHPTISREEVHRWEVEKVIPRKFWLSHLASTLNVPLDVLVAEAKLSRMNRREFLSLSALTVAHRKLAVELTSSIASFDAGPLATVQTTHGTDLVIAALSDRASKRNLKRWMYDGDSPILRVNAAGIMAKLPDQEASEQVAVVLDVDAEIRQLYTTAVIARVGAIPWETASAFAMGKAPTPKQAQFLASRFTREALNPRDSGARWCSATMLREISPLLTLPPEQYPETFR
jgi:transcriptional regulator with XRE-family HTH domain